MNQKPYIPCVVNRNFSNNSNVQNEYSKDEKLIDNFKDKLNNEYIDNLVKSVERKRIPNRSEIEQKKLIANKQKFQYLKKKVIEQISEYGLSQKKKYRINEIKEKIGYKSNNTRIRNTIKDLIGIQLFKIFFGGEFGQKPKYNLKDIFLLAESIGKERYGVSGIVTQRGIKLFLKKLKSGVCSSKARTEIWCQREGHPPFTPVIDKLVHERSWCIKCYADARMKSYDEVLIVGTDNGWILDETIETFAIKMRNRGSKFPKDVRLNWKCLKCGTPKNYSYHNIQKKTEGEASGCKTCFSRNLEITKTYAEKVGREKGIELDMTDEEFETAKEEMRKQNRAPAQAKLIWKIRGRKVPLTFNYVAYLMKSKARYRFTNYISPTGHRSSEGENYGRKILQKLFGVRFDHTLLREIVGDQVDISGKIEKIHPRSHVDGYNIVSIRGKDFKIVYEFWEMYHHNYYNSKNKDEFKKILFNQEGIILIILTDEQDPIDFQQIIAKQFEKQTGIIIQHQYQEKLDTFIEG
ncbi:MAG: hypothetical protein KAW51_04040 [Candidatus Lokiarchaeota archaeon]|nr:hypothetical protein [Candidatus Lokiarchaeota archaeon]